MVTLGEIVRWIVYTVGSLYRRAAARLLRRDRLLIGSERKFRALLEAAPDAMVIVDWHGHIALVNVQTEKLFGYARDELIGQNVTDLVPERFRAQHREHQRAYMKDAHARPMGSGLDLFGLRKDGSEFPIEISLSPLRTDQGLLVSSAIRDITVHKLVEAELTSRADALERSNRDLEHFAYVASHDLSEPLRVVSGFIELLSRRYSEQLDDDANEFIRYSLDGVQRMQQLIDDLLAYSHVRQQLGPLPLVDCGEVVAQVLATLAEPIAEAGAQVNVGELPAVRAERSQMGQLFQNLIGNAVKFRAAEAPLVDVSAAREAESWRISIRDNGIGIDPAKSEQIFKMFERLHTSEQFPGTGIGLAICKRIVEFHGGEMGAAPAPGGGTVFWFTLADVTPVTKSSQSHPTV